jgi:hypothetical protein
MRSWLLSALKKRFLNSSFDQFATEHGHDWLVWEPGSWLPPARVTMAGSLDKPSNPSKSGEALAIALDQSMKSVTLGREGDGDEIILNDGTLSKKHLSLEFDGFHWLVSDLKSRNGTQLNGLKLGASPEKLSNGAQLKCGQVHLTFYVPNGMLNRLKQTR